MKRRTTITLLSALLCLVGCDKSNTSHPDHGKIALTMDWSACANGIDLPTVFIFRAGDYTATISNTSDRLDHLFEPGAYRIRIYNTPEHISVSGATVTVGEASGNMEGTGKFVREMPGWFFSCVKDTVIEKDREYELTAVMQQQVGQLTLQIEPTGGMADKIERIEGYLSGVASTLNMDDGTHAVPLNVALEFTKVTDGANAGKWAATVRLLGVAGSGQKLHAQIYFEDNTPKPVTLTDADGSEGCVLTEALADFNKDKKTPLALGGKIVETPTSAGFTATITDWTPVKGGSVVAN